MASVNKVILVGNIGADPEVKYMPSGGAVAALSIATTSKWTDKNTGQKNENTEWHRVVFFNRLAEIVGEYLRKGSQIYIEGSLRTRKWQDQSGQDRYTTEIVVREMQMLGSGKVETGAAGGGQSQPDQQQQRQQQPQQRRRRTAGSAVNGQQARAEQAAKDQNFDNYDDDIPF